MNLNRKDFLVKSSTGFIMAVLASFPMFDWFKKKAEGVLPTLPYDLEKMGRLFAEIIEMVEDTLDYEGLTRQVFKTRELGLGEIQKYKKRINSPSLFITENGKELELVTRTSGLFPAECWIYRNINILEKFLKEYAQLVSLGKASSPQFISYIKETANRLAYYFMVQEDRNTLKLLYQAAVESGNVIKIDKLDKATFNRFKNVAKKNKFDIDKLVFSRSELGDLKKYCDKSFDPVRSRELLLSGIYGQMWGATIFVSAGVDESGMDNVSVPAGMVFAIPDNVGQMTRRIPLTALPMEQMGAFAHNAKRMFPPTKISKATKNSYGMIVGELVSQLIPDISKVIVGVKSDCVVPEWMKISGWNA